jgi:hypothetical protein
VSDQSEDAGGEGVDWPLGLPRLASSQPLKGGFICSTTMGFLADGREVVVKRCPYPAEVEADGLAALAGAGAPVPAVLGSPATCWCWNASAARRTGRPSGGPSPGCTGGPGTASAGTGTLPGHDPPAQRLE